MAAVTLSMRLVAIHFDRLVVDPVCGRAAEDGSAGPWRKEPNMAATTGRPTWEACSTHEHSRALHLPLCNRRCRQRRAAPKKMAQVLTVAVWLVTAAQPPAVTPESVIETPDEGS